MIPARSSCRYGDGSDFKNGLRKNVGLDLGRRLLVVLKTAKVDESQAIRVVDHGEQQKEALRRLYDAQVLLQSYEEQLSSRDEQLQSIMACVKKAIRETNGDSLRDPVLVRCLGLSEEELQEEGIITVEKRSGGKLARFEARPDQAFENQKWEEQQDRDRKAREMLEVTGSISIPASPQSFYGAEHELSWFKIPYWLKGDEETRAIIHNMKQHFVDEMNAKGHFDHNNFQEHLWQCGLQVAQRWAGVPNQELIKQAEAAEQKARAVQRESLQETSMLRQHIKRVERKYKELQSNVGKMQKAMSTMANQLKEARDTAAMYGMEMPPPHEAERRPSDLLETPTYVRLKFFGEGRDFEKAPPIKGTFRDELSEVVVQWLGSPGAWQLATVANWPLTAEAMRRPTTERCPLVVHEKLAEDIKKLRESMATFQEELEKRLTNMDGATDKKAVKDVADQVQKAEEYFNQTYYLAGNSVGVRRPFFVIQAWMLILVNILIALCIGTVSVIALEKARHCVMGIPDGIPKKSAGRSCFLLGLMGSGASKRKKRPPPPADLDWWYSTPLEYGFQGPLLLRESSVRFPLQSLGDPKDVLAPEETGVPKDADPDVETGTEETLLPAYSSYEFLCERMQQRMTALQEALRQLQAEEAVEDTTRLPPLETQTEQEWVEQRAAPFEREELEATEEPRQDPPVDAPVADAAGSSGTVADSLEDSSDSILLFEPLSEFLRNQLHEKMAALEQALEALATPRATPRELQAEERDSSSSDAKPSLEEDRSEAVPHKEAEEASDERRHAVPETEIFVEEPWLHLDCANVFLQQRLQEDLASLEDAVGRIGDFHIEDPSRCTSPIGATFGALRTRLQDNLREEEFTRFLDVLKGQVDRPEPCLTATPCNFPAGTSGPCQHPYEGMPLPELPILGSLRLREAPQVPSQCSRAPRAPRALQFTVPHMDFGRAADAVLEFSYAGVHRQEAVTKLLENRPLLLPLTDAKKSCRSLGRQGIQVSLLRLCETANFVLHPGCSVYTWASGSTKIGFRLSGRETRTQDMMQWHMRYIAGLLEATLLERPKNPFSFMASSLLASPAELAALRSLADVVAFSSLPEELWTSFAKQLGNPPSVRILAMVPASVLQKTILGLRIPSGAAPAEGSPPPTRDPNVTETIQMAVVWRVARQAVGLEDMDPMLPGATSSSAAAPAAPPVSGTPTVAATTGAGGAGQSPAKKVKLSNVIDQTDDTEIAVKTRAEMGIYYENHREITGSDPLPEVEPTDLQVAAMEDKVVVRDESPYADFSILTPFGRRIQRVMKTKSYAFQPDGTWKAADIPGPPSFVAWQACFRVFRSILFMLRYNPTSAPAGGAPVGARRGLVTRQPLVVQPHSLERYFEAFKELCLEFPECWHLLMPAEDRMRAERFEHLRRNLGRAHTEGKLPLDVDYNPATPWDGVFQAAALDHQYWDANVRRPAVAFLARLGHFAQPTLEPLSEGAKASVANVEAALGASSSTGPVSPGGKRPRKRKKETAAEPANTGKPATTKTGVEEKFSNKTHPKKWGGLFHSTPEGRELCYTWAKGDSPDACSEPCAANRAPLDASVVRPFRFLELFAGQAGFSGAVALACGHLVEVMNHQDAWTTSWDILNDGDFEAARAWVREADHTHLAPPCKSFTRARRSDKHGTAKILRSPAQPAGWGDPMAEEGNKIAERVGILLDEAEAAGNTSSVENPEDSFIWEQQTLKRHVNKKEKVGLDQCPYGAETKKPTGILTDADWMKTVCNRCHQARPHEHMPGGLSGRTMDYFFDPPREVWKTSLAAEYPTGLCWAWAKALEKFLKSTSGQATLVKKTFTVSGKSLKVVEAEVKTKQPSSNKERREMENNKAVGGLRNPFQCHPKQHEGLEGFKEETAEEAAKAMAATLGIAHGAATPLRVDLLAALLSASLDPEKDVQNWLKDGFPLGIEKELTVNTVFPVTDEDTKAVELSRQFPLLTDWAEVDQAENYKSFQEAGDAALEELERVAAAGYATKCHSWAEVVQSTGEGASLTKLGCIQKPKPGGGVKTRLVVDCRRSGINGLMIIRQRVVLPRVSDVALDWVMMMREDNDASIQFAVIDFKDAFYQCRLARSERKHVVVKASGATYFILEVVAFGLACGPLLWSRLAAALVRLAQGACWDTARVQCYVDDPVLVVKGHDALAKAINLAVPLLLWQALGCQLSWNKMQLGNSVQWIGFCMQLKGDCMVAQLSEDKLAKLQAALNELLAAKGVIPVQQLRAVAGLLGWLTSIVKLARPWVGMLWGSVAECEARVPQLVFAKQVSMALRTLARMTQCGTLVATYHWQPRALWQIQTDASVYGFGGILWYGRRPVAWWADTLQPCDLALLGATAGDPAWQSEWELMAVAISVRLFGPKLLSQAVHLTTDNTGVLHTALNLRASSPGMVILAAELACGLRQFDIDLQQGDHVRSAANYLADALSLVLPPFPVPTCAWLAGCGGVTPCCRAGRSPRPAVAPADRVTMWAARLLPASQQRRFAGAGGCDPAARRRIERKREELVAQRYAARQAEIVRSREDYASGPVRLERADGFDPWRALAERVCQLCSRKPVIGYCCKCRVELCGACINRMPTAPFKWICLDCACTSDESGDQARLLVACQNEEVARRKVVLAQPGMSTEDELAGALAERVLGDKRRHLEMAWWAEAKRKDWGFHDERPVMPHAVMKAYADHKFPPQEEEEDDAKVGNEPSAGSREPHPGSGDTLLVCVKTEPKEDQSTPSEEDRLGKRRKVLLSDSAEKEPQGLRAPTTPAGTPAS
eukprot:s2094_g10.t1